MTTLALIPGANTQIDMAGIMIKCRPSDCYIHASAMCKAGGKEFKKYKAFAQDFLTELSNDLEIDVERDSAPVHGSTAVLLDRDWSQTEDKGFWIHPYVAIDLAQWISLKFRVKVVKWIMELFAFGSVTLGKERSTEETINGLRSKLDSVMETYHKERENHKMLETSHATMSEARFVETRHIREMERELKMLRKKVYGFAEDPNDPELLRVYRYKCAGGNRLLIISALESNIEQHVRSLKFKEKIKGMEEIREWVVDDGSKIIDELREQYKTERTVHMEGNHIRFIKRSRAKKDDDDSDDDRFIYDSDEEYDITADVDAIIDKQHQKRYAEAYA